jgi:hypothetical protein
MARETFRVGRLGVLGARGSSEQQG